MKKLIFLVLIIISITINAQEYITPPMINIEAGNFMMGSEHGDDSLKPVHSVTVEAFQMGKYPVTVAEFRMFVKESGYNPKSNCFDFIDDKWFSSSEGTASWDKHRFQKSNYQPVSCISLQDIDAYIRWISNKTGTQYRLPTEQEWEYAAKANTSSRYFWGDDLTLTQAHLYGNFADEAGEYFASKEYGASYVGFIEHSNGNDGEPYNSIVGLYRPNPFGLYDMVGNTSQLLSSCYHADGYKEHSKEEMNAKKCKFIAQRGGTWHNLPQPHWLRGRYKKEDAKPSSMTGFRLATDGHKEKVDISSTTFEKVLKEAQEILLTKRPKIPATPKNIQLINLKNNSYKLSWELSNNSNVISYEIYRSNSNYAHLLGQFYQQYFDKFETVDAKKNSIEVMLPNAVGSFRVVAITNELTSLPSKPVGITKGTTVSIPGKITMENTIALENVNLWYRDAKENKPEVYYLSKVNKSYEQPLVTTTFNVDVKKSGWYILNYKGRSFQKGTFFKLWSSNILLGEISYDADVDDKTSNRHKVFLEKGIHNLQLSITRDGFDYWNLFWLEFRSNVE